MIGAAIIGCGSIGQKRAKILKNFPDVKMVFCVDAIKERAESLATLFQDCKALTDWQEILKNPEVTLVIISTLHASLAEIAEAALLSGKHVFVEKPAGKKSHE